MTGKYVVVQSDKFGVFVGMMSSLDDLRLHLSDARRVYCKIGRDEVSYISLHGPAKEHKFSETFDDLPLLKRDVSRVLRCVSQAEQKFRSAKAEML